MGKCGDILEEFVKNCNSDFRFLLLLLFIRSKGDPTFMVLWKRQGFLARLFGKMQAIQLCAQIVLCLC
jgi:hypothetical protein